MYRSFTDMNRIFRVTHRLVRKVRRIHGSGTRSESQMSPLMRTTSGIESGVLANIGIDDYAPFGPVGRSDNKLRFFHLATVLGLIP